MCLKVKPPINPQIQVHVQWTIPPASQSWIHGSPDQCSSQLSCPLLKNNKVHVNTYPEKKDIYNKRVKFGRFCFELNRSSRSD